MIIIITAETSFALVVAVRAPSFLSSYMLSIMGVQLTSDDDDDDVVMIVMMNQPYRK